MTEIKTIPLDLQPSVKHFIEFQKYMQEQMYNVITKGAVIPEHLQGKTEDATITELTELSKNNQQ